MRISAVRSQLLEEDILGYRIIRYSRLSGAGKPLGDGKEETLSNRIRQQNQSAHGKAQEVHSVGSIVWIKSLWQAGYCTVQQQELP